MAYDSVADVRSYLSITGTTLDTFIADSIQYLSEDVDRRTGRAFTDITLGSAFNTHTVSEIQFIEGDMGVLLREWPVQQVVEVQDDEVVIAADKYVLDGSIGWVQFIDASDKMPFPRWGRLDVTYVGGFEDVPFGVKMWLRRGTDYLMQRQLHEGVGADLLGDTQVTFRPPRVAGKASTELDDIFEETAGQYRLDIMRTTVSGVQ